MNREIDAYMHKFSRAITAEGQIFPDQTTVKSGHNISYVEVRAEEVPVCDSITERNTNLLTSGIPGTRSVKDVELQKIIKFYDRAPLTCLTNTNGEAWVLLDENNVPIKGFIDPTDRLIDGRRLSNGYKVVMYAENGRKISPHQGWSFEAYSGLFKFDSNKTPEKMGWGIPRVEVFRYIGKSVKEKFGDITQLIECSYNNVDAISAVIGDVTSSTVLSSNTVADAIDAISGKVTETAEYCDTISSALDGKAVQIMATKVTWAADQIEEIVPGEFRTDLYPESDKIIKLTFGSNNEIPGKILAVYEVDKNTGLETVVQPEITYYPTSMGIEHSTVTTFTYNADIQALSGFESALDKTWKIYFTKEILF